MPTINKKSTDMTVWITNSKQQPPGSIYVTGYDQQQNLRINSSPPLLCIVCSSPSWSQKQVAYIYAGGPTVYVANMVCDWLLWYSTKGRSFGSWSSSYKTPPIHSCMWVILYIFEPTCMDTTNRLKLAQHDNNNNNKKCMGMNSSAAVNTVEKQHENPILLRGLAQHFSRTYFWIHAFFLFGRCIHSSWRLWKNDPVLLKLPVFNLNVICHFPITNSN